MLGSQSIATPKRQKKKKHDFLKFWIFGPFWRFQASRTSKSGPGSQIMLVDKISAKMDGYGPLLKRNYKNPKKNKESKRNDEKANIGYSILQRRCGKK